MMGIPFENTYARLPERFYARQAPAASPRPRLLASNRSLAEKLGVDADWLASPEGVSVLAGNAVAEASEPLAQAYAGHQFGHFVPQLGDGRALLLGEVVAASGGRFDIQLKGSGRTAFSRNGDGKSALGPVLREYLVSEAMAAMGIPTTRALAAVATGETVFRQEGEVPGGVFTRVAASHVRVGTFEYFARRGDLEGVKVLADYVVERHYPELLGSEQPYLALLAAVAERQASLIASWMGLGFIHGVMNTDNMAVSGETIDYGPCAFMDGFHPDTVFSSIDSRGRYAWGRQGEIGLWNLSRLAEALLPLIDEKQDAAIRLAESELRRYYERFEQCLNERFCDKLGVESGKAGGGMVERTLALLASQRVDFTLFFRRLTQLRAGEASEGRLGELFEDASALRDWIRAWEGCGAGESSLAIMRAANPIRIPRNHRVEEAIAAAYRGDMSVFDRAHEAWSHPFEEADQFSEYESPPLEHERVRATFCGT